MQIESVTAGAFGPLRNQTLTLGPGLNVVVGRNESAKSTWHAAIFAAICGKARRRGALRQSERAFAQQYRPWTGSQWSVEAEIRLDDDRRVDLRHDLEGGVDCGATDTQLGRDVSSEIMYDGAPDGSVWLGMNREVFYATACVRQSQVMAVLSDARALQRQLQLAASHAGQTDQTASEAIQRIKDYSSEQVGLDRANARRPLRLAMNRVEAARQALQEAEQAHADYADLVAEAKRLSDEAADRRAELNDLEDRKRTRTSLQERAAKAHASAEAAATAQTKSEGTDKALEGLEARLATAETLDAELEGREPSGNLAADDLAAAVTEALTRWSSRPTHPDLEGPDSAELRRRLDLLPPAPEGDLEAHMAVHSAVTALDRADAVAVSLQEERPDRPDPSPGVHAGRVVGAMTLREWASRLDSAQGVDPGKLLNGRAELEAAEQRQQSAKAAAETADSAYETALAKGGDRVGSKPRNAPLLGAVVASVALFITAFVMTVTGKVVIGAALGLAGLAAAAVAGVVHRKERATVGAATGVSPTPESLRQQRAAAHEHLSEAERELYRHQQTVISLEQDERDSSVTISDITARCEPHGLPVSPHDLRVLAAEVETHERQQQEFSRWESRARRNEQEVAVAEDSLRQALTGRGVATTEDSDVRALLAHYAAECDQRAEQARASATRAALEQRLESRENAEADATKARKAEQDALHQLQDVAHRIGVEVPDPEHAETLIAGLRTWQRKRREEASRLDERRAAWTELQTQLNGLTLPELRAQTEDARLQSSQLRDKAASAWALNERQRSEMRRAAAESGTDLPEHDDAVLQHLESLMTDVSRSIDSTRSQWQDSQVAAGKALGKQSDRAQRLRSVAEAGETLAQCEAELDRVRRLSSTLETTRQHLEDAQETVHRDIAPVLQRTLVEWLPLITDNRYSRAAVDPQTLEVRLQVGSGEWVCAEQLSLGTAEQVYLLLRVALVTHLSDPATKCPLLLDDVTVQADEIRTRAVLDALEKLAGERQIVLFGQEPAVREWATERLKAGADITVVELEQVPA